MGLYTIRQVLLFTQQSKFQNRYKYRDRDVLKGITIQKVNKFKKDLFAEKATIYYRIIATSVPQYYPYSKTKGKISRTQRKRKHHYDVTLEITGNISIDNTDWKIRTGSQKKPSIISQNLIQQIRKETRKKWELEAYRKFKTKKDQVNYVKEKIEKHKERAKYISNQDADASINGVNYDHFYRQSWVFHKAGHLWGINLTNRPPKITNSKKILFFNKLELRVIELLLQAGFFTKKEVKEEKKVYPSQLKDNKEININKDTNISKNTDKFSEDW